MARMRVVPECVPEFDTGQVRGSWLPRAAVEFIRRMTPTECLRWLNRDRGEDYVNLGDYDCCFITYVATDDRSETMGRHEGWSPGKSELGADAWNDLGHYHEGELCYDHDIEPHDAAMSELDERVEKRLAQVAP